MFFSIKGWQCPLAKVAAKLLLYLSETGEMLVPLLLRFVYFSHDVGLLFFFVC